MKSPSERDDVSRFVVHLTRRYDETSAQKILISILNERKIEARNAHCLFSPLFSELGFSSLLKSKFKTVCFTETPLTQIASLCRTIPGRRIKLRPYGVVFYRDIYSILAVVQRSTSTLMGLKLTNT